MTQGDLAFFLYEKDLRDFLFSPQKRKMNGFLNRGMSLFAIKGNVSFFPSFASSINETP